MLTSSDLRALVAAGGTDPSLDPDQRRRALADAVEALGTEDGEVVAAAIVGLDDEDRNVRAAMLRVLGLFASPAAAEGIVRGLRDPVRRVREVAARSAQPHHLASTRVVDALRRIIEDDQETDRLRCTAFFVLSSGSTRRSLPPIAHEAIGSLLHSERFRGPLLRRIVSSIVRTPETESLLREFVRIGTKDEAVMATRALCGQVLLRTDIVPETERRRIREAYDREDDLHRWVPAPLADELVTHWAEAERDRR